PTKAADKETHKPSNFLRQIIEKDVAEGTYASRRWGGSPGDAAHHAAGQPDPAKVRLRFPPEPNGYLHIGHAKAICLNFGLARDLGGTCNLRFDDTNPTTEDVEYVEAIEADIRWLGFQWSNLHYASDYFEQLYQYAEKLIQKGVAYVDQLNEEEIREYRGNYYKKGKPSPWRD